MRRDGRPPAQIRLLTWPLPWWEAVVPAVAIAVVSAAVVLQARGWAFIAPARLSGMVRESLLVAGPVAGTAAARVAVTYSGRLSALGPPEAPRGAGRAAARSLLVITAWWCLGLLVGGAGATVAMLRLATGGRFHPVELAFAVFGLAFFVVSGFAVGVVVGRWHGVLWAALWSLSWATIAPVAYAISGLDSGTNSEYFMFPALPASDHRGLATWTLLGIAGWWLLVLATVVAVIVTSLRARAGLGRRPVAAAVGATLVVALAGPFVPRVLPTVFVDLGPEPLACTTAHGLSVCVTEEQAVVLPDVVSGTGAIVSRMGDRFPTQISTVLSGDARDSLRAQGQEVREGEYLYVGVGVSSGADTVEFDLATGLGGLDACVQGVSADAAIAWAFAFGNWLAGFPDESRSGDRRAVLLSERSDDEVLTWYAAHADEILACRYTGDGPP